MPQAPSRSFLANGASPPSRRPRPARVEETARAKTVLTAHRVITPRGPTQRAGEAPFCEERAKTGLMAVLAAGFSPWRPWRPDAPNPIDHPQTTEPHPAGC